MENGIAALLAAIGFTLARALITHHGVGIVEYFVGAGLLALLALSVFRSARRAIQRG
jgi:hypothetical protein